MNANCDPRRSRREWLVALTTFSIFLNGMISCTGDLGGLDVGNLDDLLGGTDAGFFVNSDASSKLRVARGSDEKAFFVFGTLDANGNLADVQSIVARDENGGESFVSFEQGRPVHAEGVDGSYAHATYTEVTSTSLAGVVEIFNAADGSKQTHTFSVDLKKALEDLAAEVEAVTGESLDVISQVDNATVQTGKARGRSLTITVLPLYGGFVFPLVAAVSLMSVVLGQMMVTLYASAIVLSVKLLLKGVFAPVFLISSLLGATLFNIRLTDIDSISISIPDPPTIIIS
jgi:hypothetical protein